MNQQIVDSQQIGIKQNVKEKYQAFPIIERRNLFQEYLEVPAMVKSLNLPKHKRILEIGCGLGIAFPPLYKLCRPARLVGIDIEEALIEGAKRRLQKRQIPAEFFSTDVRNLPFEANSFDIVVDFGTCYHISHPEKALTEIERVLSPGGLFVHETPISQLLSHPVRSFGRFIPWKKAECLRFKRTAVLWTSRIKSNYKTDSKI